jgi:glycosyltransferase involved in cell wall biosynthesis
MGVTVVVASIPPRAALLYRALTSVQTQTLPPDRVIVSLDYDRRGPAATRNLALQAVDTEWVAFLDDDDELGPDHLRRLVDYAAETNADMVYPWYRVVGGTDPRPERFGTEFDPDDPHSPTVTFLARTDAVRKVGGFPAGECEEQQLTVNLARAGFTVRHLPERTWTWHHHSSDGRQGNTSGRTDRW